MTNHDISPTAPDETTPQPKTIDQFRAVYYAGMIEEDGSLSSQAHSAMDWYLSLSPDDDLATMLDDLHIAASLLQDYNDMRRTKSARLLRSEGDCWQEIARHSDDQDAQQYALNQSIRAYESLIEDSQRRGTEHKDILSIVVNALLTRQYALSQLTSLRLFQLQLDRTNHHIGAEAFTHTLTSLLDTETGEIEDFRKSCAGLIARTTTRRRNLRLEDTEGQEKLKDLSSEPLGILWERAYLNMLRRAYHAQGNDELALQALPACAREDAVFNSIPKNHVDSPLLGFDATVVDASGQARKIQLKKRPTAKDSEYEDQGIDVIYPPSHQGPNEFLRFISLCTDPLPPPGSKGFESILRTFEPGLAAQRSQNMRADYLKRLSSPSIVEIVDAAKNIVNAA